MLAAQSAALGVKTELGFNFRPPRVINVAAVLKLYHLCPSNSIHGRPLQAAEKFLCLLYEYPLMEHARKISCLGLLQIAVIDQHHHHSQFMHTEMSMDFLKHGFYNVILKHGCYV